MVLQTQVTMNLFLVIVSLTIATPLRNVVNPVVSNGSALRKVLEMIQMTLEMTTTTTMMMMTSSMPRMS